MMNTNYMYNAQILSIAIIIIFLLNLGFTVFQFKRLNLRNEKIIFILMRIPVKKIYEAIHLFSICQIKN